MKNNEEDETTNLKISIPSNLELILKILGLSDKQINIYQTLLKLGTARVNHISKYSGVNRSNAYVLLKELLQEGLVDEFKKLGIVYYHTTSPQILLKKIKEKEQYIANTRQLTEFVVDDLATTWKYNLNRPVIRHFKGRDGVLEVFEDVYAADKSEIVGCVGFHKADQEIFNEIVKKFKPLRIKRKIFTRALNSHVPIGIKFQENDKKNLSEIFLADPDKYPLPAEIDVYNNKIAFMSLKDSDFVGLIIENNDFATTLQSVFRLLFDLLREKKIK